MLSKTIPKNCLVLLNCPILFISFGGNLDFLQKNFYNINYCTYGNCILTKSPHNTTSYFTLSLSLLVECARLFWARHLYHDIRVDFHSTSSSNVNSLKNGLMSESFSMVCQDLKYDLNFSLASQKRGSRKMYSSLMRIMCSYFREACGWLYFIFLKQ